VTGFVGLDVGLNFHRAGCGIWATTPQSRKSIRSPSATEKNKLISRNAIITNRARETSFMLFALLWQQLPG